MSDSTLIRKIKGYDYRSFLRKHSRISPLMQDVLIAVLGAIIIVSALLFDSENPRAFTMPFVVGGTIISFYGLLLMIFTITRMTIVGIATWIRSMYQIRVDAYIKDLILTVCIRELKEAKGVSMLFLLLVLCLGFILGVFSVL